MNSAIGNWDLSRSSGRSVTDLMPLLCPKDIDFTMCFILTSYVLLVYSPQPLRQGLTVTDELTENAADDTDEFEISEISDVKIDKIPKKRGPRIFYSGQYGKQRNLLGSLIIMYMRPPLWMISSLLSDGGDLAAQLSILHGLHSTQKGSLNNICDFRFLGCLL